MAAGEVLLNAGQFGHAGTAGNPLTNLLDANAVTDWITLSPDAAAGMDAGVSCNLTRVRYSPVGGQEDLVLNGTIQGSAVAFTPGPTVGNYQGYNSFLGGASTSIVQVLNFAQTAGQTLVVYVNGYTTGVTASITDTSVNTYTAVQNAANGSFAQIFVATNIVAAAANANTLTVTFSGSVSSSIQVVQILNLVATPTDVSSNNSGNNTTPTTSLTTTGVHDIVVAFCDANGTATAGSGFAFVGHETASGTGVDYPKAACESTTVGAGTISCNFSSSVTGAWTCTAVALKGSSAVGTTIATISQRPLNGTLLNEIGVSPAPFRFYQFLSFGIGALGDLDFIVQWVTGVAGQCCTPTISPPGGQYDQPTVVTLSCITTDAALRYTTDGSTPTGASTLYSGPIVISSTQLLSVIGISASLTNSRIATAQFTIPSTMISTNSWFDVNRGYKVWAVQPSIFQDPVSGWWYMYGWNADQPGVLTFGYTGVQIYKSADLRNWIYVGLVNPPAAGTATGAQQAYAISQQILYNPSTKTYVLWTSSFNTAGGGSTIVYTAPAPSGPWTQFANYSTLNGFTNIGGDLGSFVDPATGFAYIILNVTAGSTNIIISRLNSNWTNVDGVNFRSISNNAGNPFGRQAEAHCMFFNAGRYFWMTSGTSNWVPNLNLAVSNTTGPLGTWGAPFNPFVAATIPQTSAEVAVGITATNSNAYDSQTDRGMLIIPGRNAFIYMGDRYTNGLNAATTTSLTANTETWVEIIQPMVFAPTFFTMTWNNAWTLDGTFPTISGAPLAPTNFSDGPGAGFSWQNNEPNPHCLYLDSSPNSNFGTVTQSEIITLSQFPPPSTYVPTFAVALNTWYRIRAVNANGTATSVPFIAGRAPAAGGPPAVIYSTGFGFRRIL